jgi:hypothetical protein
MPKFFGRVRQHVLYLDLWGASQKRVIVTCHGSKLHKSVVDTEGQFYVSVLDVSSLYSQLAPGEPWVAGLATAKN